MVRPIKVEAGEWDEGVDNLLEKAKELDIRLQKATSETDHSEMRSIGGVEEARPAHFFTNQQLPDTPEDVSKTTKTSGESVRFLQANPHADDGATSAHMTDGGPPDRPAGITNEKTLFGKQSDDFSWENWDQLPMCPCSGGQMAESACQCDEGCAGCNCPPVKKAELLGAWKEDNPYLLSELAEKAESLARRL
jgi:hypothetical protein